MNTNKKGVLRISGDKLVFLATTAVVSILLAILNKNFFSVTNMINAPIVASPVGLVAIGHTYLIIAGQNDLSPDSLAAFSGVIAAFLVGKRFSPDLAVLLTTTRGIMTEYFNAFMANRIYLEAFIAILVTQSTVRGFAYIICSGKPIPINSRSSLILGKARIVNISSFVRIMVLCIVIFDIILARAKFGRSVHTIGGSMDAARLAGLNPRRIITICYIMTGIPCSTGGTIFAARMNSGQPTTNVNLEFDAIMAVIPGGVSFVGSVGDMSGTILGIVLIQAFDTGLTMVNVPTFWQYVVKGGLLLFALTTDYVRKQRREKELLAASMEDL